MSKSRKLGLLAGMAAALGALGGASESHHFDDPHGIDDQPSFSWTSPIFIPKKHTKMSYAKQNRIAKARKNKSMYSKK
jgi:hypothetical protein